MFENRNILATTRAAVLTSYPQYLTWASFTIFAMFLELNSSVLTIRNAENKRFSGLAANVFTIGNCLTIIKA